METDVILVHFFEKMSLTSPSSHDDFSLAKNKQQKREEEEGK